MKGLYRHLSPFAPDQSGAVSVLFELGGLIVICDAGGCAGNICGFDEPRWFTHKSALFSAGLRDMDAIMGRDDRLMKKIGEALTQVDCSFLALIGTPVPSVIGTDFRALAHIAEKRFGLPVLTVETTGMEYYDRGQEKAYLSLFQAFAADAPDDEGPTAEIGVIGATPLDLFSLESGGRMAARLEKAGCGRTVCYGMGSGLRDIRNAGAVRCNLVVSPSGLKAAEWLRGRFGTPYVSGVPLSDGAAAEIRGKIDAALSGGPGGGEKQADLSLTDERSGRVLLIYQQTAANEMRRQLERMQFPGTVDVASWFMMKKDFSRSTDTALQEEGDLLRLLRRRSYRAVAGDPLFERAIPGWDGPYIPLPHYPVSSGIYGNAEPRAVLRQLIRCTA